MCALFTEFGTETRPGHSHHQHSEQLPFECQFWSQVVAAWVALLRQSLGLLWSCWKEAAINYG